MNLIDIRGLSKRDVFTALYNNAPVFNELGRYCSNQNCKSTLKEEDFKKFERYRWNVSCHDGVHLFIDISEDFFDCAIYDHWRRTYPYNPEMKSQEGRFAADIIHELRNSKK